MFSGKNVFQSKTKVKCKACERLGKDTEIRKDRLQDHMDKIHKGSMSGSSRNLLTIFKKVEVTKTHTSSPTCTQQKQADNLKDLRESHILINQSSEDQISSVVESSKSKSSDLASSFEVDDVQVHQVQADETVMLSSTPETRTFQDDNINKIGEDVHEDPGAADQNSQMYSPIKDVTDTNYFPNSLMDSAKASETEFQTKKSLSDKFRSVFTRRSKRRKISSMLYGSNSVSSQPKIHPESDDVKLIKDCIVDLSHKLNNIDLTSDDVKFIKDGVTTLTDKVDNLLCSQVLKYIAPEAETAVEKDAKTILVRTARSTSDIVRICPEFKCLQSENCVICDYCYTGTGIQGKFSYDFSLGDDFRDKAVPLPRTFLNLKKVLVTHLGSKFHNERVTDKELASKEKELFKSRNYNVGTKLGREAYKILKTSASYTQYETNVAVLSAQGVDVGTLNHSRMFAATFCDSVHEVLIKQIQEILNAPLPATGQPTPLAIIADKITPNRRTMQIVGFHGYVDSKFQSLVAGVPALLGEDGLSVTKTMKNGIKNLKIPQDEMSTRIVGGAFDGEYFHLNVPEHFLDSELVSEDSRHWYSFQWDPAHIIELAEADARKDSTSIQSTFDVISSVSKSFSHGKSFRQLLDETALYYLNMDEDENLIYDSENPIKQKKVRAPGHFSDTRFATYSSEVIRKFLHNYEFYYRHMNKEQDDKLDEINNAPFIFSCAALSDVYEVIGKTSNAMQKPGIPSWEVSSLFKAYLNTLKKMSDNLDNVKIDSLDKELFPSLSSVVAEVSEKGVYDSCPIFVKKYAAHNTRRSTAAIESNCNEFEDSVNISGKSIHTYIEKFVSILKGRMDAENSRNEVLSKTGKLFDVDEVLKYETSDDVKRYLEEYSRLAKDTGNLDKNLSIKDLLIEYEVFVERVKDIAPQYLYVPDSEGVATKTSKISPVKIQYPTRYLQTDLYKKMLETPSLYKDIPNTLHLLLTALCRTSCEAVVEGMGSVMNRHIKERKSLDPKTVEKETIIRWQGPHPASKDASELINASLDNHFNGRAKWHFCSTDGRAKYFNTSEVITRITKDAEANKKISFSQK